jgi:hypothetical protein
MLFHRHFGSPSSLLFISLKHEHQETAPLLMQPHVRRIWHCGFPMMLGLLLRGFLEQAVFPVVELSCLSSYSAMLCEPTKLPLVDTKLAQPRLLPFAHRLHA